MSDKQFEDLTALIIGIAFMVFTLLALHITRKRD